MKLLYFYKCLAYFPIIELLVHFVNKSGFCSYSQTLANIYLFSYFENESVI